MRFFEQFHAARFNFLRSQESVDVHHDLSLTSIKTKHQVRVNILKWLKSFFTEASWRKIKNSS